MSIINCIKFTLMTLLFVSVSIAFAEIRSTKIRSDGRLIIPFDEFSFTHTARLELNVSQISVMISITISDSVSIPKQEFARLGFFLCTRDAWLHVLQQINDRDISCALESEFITSVFTFNNTNVVDESFQAVYVMSNPDQYMLMFANCINDLKVSMNVKSAMYNLEGKNGVRDYLSAGKTVLPTFYFSLSLIYFPIVCLWVYTSYKEQSTFLWVEFCIIAGVILNTLNLLCEAEDKTYIKKSGTAYEWDVLLYIFTFMKGTMLFSLLIPLIAFIEFHLYMWLRDLPDKEKKVLMMARGVIRLQAVASIAQVLIDETGPCAQDWVTRKQFFLLVDVVCCCGVLFLVDWSIKILGNRDFAYHLKDLIDFRHCYVVVIRYIYFTRVVAYTLDLWTSVVAAELAKLVFCAVLLWWTRKVAAELAKLFLLIFVLWLIYLDKLRREEKAVVEQLMLQDSDALI